MSILKKPKHLTAVGSPMTLEFSLSLPCDYMSSPLLRTWMSTDSLFTYLPNPYANSNLRWGLEDGLGLDNVPRMGPLWWDWHSSRRKRYKLYFLPLYLQASKRQCEHLGSVVFKLKEILTSNQTNWHLYLDLFSLPEYEKLMSVSTNSFIVLCCGSLGWNLKDGSFVYQHASPHDLLLCTELSTESAKGRARLCI